MKKRLTIPAKLKRKILEESGYRCAIPICKQTPVELAHIIPWNQVKEHTFENLIALCPICHTRYDKGDIDRKSIQQYKSNLSIINGRYGDLERRVLEIFAEEKISTIWIPGGLDIMLRYLVKDGLLSDTGKSKGMIVAGVPFQRLYALTLKGQQFVDEYINGNDID